MIHLKSPAEINLMVEGGKKLAEIRNLLVSRAKSGVTTQALDELAKKEILAFGGRPSFTTVRHYPYTTCISVNDEVVHGLPGKRKLALGDVVKIDLGMIYGDLHTDTTDTIQVDAERSRSIEGKNESETERFLRVGKETLGKAIGVVKPGNRIGHISQAIQENIEKAGYSEVKVLTGHGIGRVLHEEPMIPQFLDGPIENTPEIKPGMTFAIEVIYNLGTGLVVMRPDGWTIASEDGKISATFEKSLAVGEKGVIVLTP
ncbi:MAG: Methionine aminopeptidase 1 [Microgenomates group bacterium ADurb.Bin219]|nr:MAG: Methionine aminopeptidase 1 [Microgenomates group bacterium ADurb.Bin219]HNP89201.1 type I methionyl aminopeptidase [Candidatus Woesebacteria bacterium]